VAGPDIAGEEAAVESIFAASKELHGFSNFERGYEVDDGAEDADGIAGFFEALAGGGIEQAGEARRDAGTDG